MEWTQLHPNAHGDWLNQRNDIFGSFIPLGDKDNKGNKQTFFVPYYSNGLKTQRDAWCYNFSQKNLQQNIQETTDYYNSMVESGRATPVLDATRISWSANLQTAFFKKREIIFEKKDCCIALYRPFNKLHVYFNRELNERVYKIPKLFPIQDAKNLIICLPGIGGRWLEFSSFILTDIPDLHFHNDGSQCFPLYYYEKRSAYQSTLFDTGNEEYTRKDGITNFILARCRESYGPKVTKEDIFYYVYGLLHSPDYRKAFAADLKKMLPRIPLVEKPADFWTFSKAGRALADLHLNYETQPACGDVVVEGAEHGNFHVEKIRFPDKKDKSVIEFNPWIKLTNIPLEAYGYVVNGRSAIEWVMERYQIKTDKASGITNDPNDWAQEQGKPRYILDLLLSVVTVSIETMKIVEKLPNLYFE